MFTKLVVVSLVSFLIVFTSLGYTSARQSPQPTQNPPETIAEQNRKIIQAALEKSRIQTEGENGKPRLMVQLGHSGPVTSVAFSPDGQFVLTGSADNTARVWDAETGKELARMVGHSDGVNTAAFSPDGKNVVTASSDKTARVWEVETGKELARTIEHQDIVHRATFSLDGKQVVTTSNSERRFDAVTGKELDRTEKVPDSPFKEANSVGGKRVEIDRHNPDHSARVSDAKTGEELLRLEGYSYPVWAVAFSPDGERIVTAGDNTTALVWDVRSGKEQTRLHQDSEKILSVAFSPDGKRIVTAGEGITARVWDANDGKELVQMNGHYGKVLSAVFSPDGKQIVTTSWDYTVRVWDTADGKELFWTQRYPNWVRERTFSSDRKRIVTSLGFIIRLGVKYAAFSPDGKRIVTTSSDYMAQVWDTANRRELFRFEGAGPVNYTAFSPDGKRIITASDDQIARVWEVDTEKELARMEGHPDAVWSAGFSSDGKQVVTASLDGTVCVWDAANGILLQVFGGHLGPVYQVQFSPDGRFVITAGNDGTTRLWDPATGKELCQLIPFRDGTWAIIDPEGRYDASNGGDVQGLHWVVGTEPIALSQLKDRYYEPGLLAKIMGFNTEPLREVQAFQNVKLYPEIKCEAPGKSSTRTRITLTNQGGGIGKVVVKLNGKEVIADARGPKPDPNATQVTLPIDLDSPFLERGKPNKVQIFAYNAEGYLSSRGTEIIWTPDGTVDEAPPELYAIVAGISDYNGTQIDLKFAAKDADDVAKALELGASKLFNVDDTERVHITLLSTSSDNPKSIPPTKENFRQAFEAIKAKAKPQDVVVVYLAGHGVKLPNVEDTYCYLTRDARNTNLSDPDVVKLVAITSDELSEWMKLPAQKQVMILDTCAAGAAATKLIENRTISGDQIRAIDRMKDRTGFYILMGSAADAVSYETTQYGQGLLTYALLQGMKGAALREGEFADIGRLFEYAVDNVPQLARHIGGIQRPFIAAPRGSSFDVARFTDAEKKLVPLAIIKPLILRPNFLNDEEKVDDLELSTAVRKQLNEENLVVSRESEPGLVYVDGDELPGAIRPSGTYLIKGQKVTVTVVLRRDKEKVASLTVEGDREKVAELSKKLVQAIAKAAPRAFQ